MSAATKKPLVANSESRQILRESSIASPNRNPIRSTPSTTNTGSIATRSRSLRGSTPASSRASFPRQGTGTAKSYQITANSEADDESKFVNAELTDDLKERLRKSEELAIESQKQIQALQLRLEETLKEKSNLEEKVHENEERIEILENEKREAIRSKRELEAIYEAEKVSVNKEREEASNRQQEMQTIIQRLKDNQNSAANGDEDCRTNRRSNNTTPNLDNGQFTSSSGLNRSDSMNNSKLLLQKDRLIESLRMELAESQIKISEFEIKIAKSEAMVAESKIKVAESEAKVAESEIKAAESDNVGGGQLRDIVLNLLDKDLPVPPRESSDTSVLKRAKTITMSGTRRPRPQSFMPSSSYSHSLVTDLETAPSIPFNLHRPNNHRNIRPHSEQFTGSASIAVSQMIRNGPTSPPLHGGHSPRHPSTPVGNQNNGQRIPSLSQSSVSGNFPGTISESSSNSSEAGDFSTHSNNSPPRLEKATTFAGNKPRPLRLLQESGQSEATRRAEEAAAKLAKRSSWMGWAFGKKEDAHVEI
ncbi:putative m serotype protein [Erysiphe neolycopersici]|uniref:Putative m serotype protein n=1 Tax=Erysiphe neolycopersici TaxID=212602 RepID=A0A420HX12_9PEZI|nr:putative m serotype protein [Erysiphe neolycopersici]